MESNKFDETFFDKIPDEILQEILKHVPVSSIKNCFLVSKRFKQESINATRNGWKLRIDEQVLKSGDALLKTERLFDEVDWICTRFMKKFMRFPPVKRRAENFFKKFGHRIKKFSMFNSKMTEKNLLTLLSYMPNLVELGLQCDRINNKTNKPETTSSMFTNLKRIHLVDSTWSFIEQLSCPSLMCFSFNESKLNIAPDYRILYRFICRHTNITDISLLLGLEDPFMRSYFSVDHLTLENFTFLCVMQSTALLPFTFFKKQNKLNLKDLEPGFQEDNNKKTLRQYIIGCPELLAVFMYIGEVPITEENVQNWMGVETVDLLV